MEEVVEYGWDDTVEEVDCLVSVFFNVQADLLLQTK